MDGGVEAAAGEEVKAREAKYMCLIKAKYMCFQETKYMCLIACLDAVISFLFLQ
jgi:hypothetical protein